MKKELLDLKTHKGSCCKLLAEHQSFRLLPSRHTHKSWADTTAENEMPVVLYGNIRRSNTDSEQQRQGNRMLAPDAGTDSCSV